MEYLKDKNVYLAGPINACEDGGTGWRDYVTPILKERYGLNVNDPCKKTTCELSEIGDDKKQFIELLKSRDFAKARKEFFPIVRNDLVCVDHSHFIIVMYDATVHCVGTIHELVMADILRRPVLMKYSDDHIDQGIFNIWTTILTRPEWMHPTWESMFEYLNKIHAGNIDSDYWIY